MYRKAQYTAFSCSVERSARQRPQSLLLQVSVVLSQKSQWQGGYLIDCFKYLNAARQNELGISV